jgi:hypothetical protein
MRDKAGSSVICFLAFSSLALAGCSGRSCADLANELAQAKAQSSAAQTEFEKTADPKYSNEMIKAQQRADELQYQVQNKQCTHQ